MKELESNDNAYHSQHMASCLNTMIEQLREVIPNPKLRPDSWVSTAIIEAEIMSEELKYASAEYFTDNLSNPVYFYENLHKIPKEAVVVEVGPHPLFAKSIKETIDSVDYITLMKKNSNDTNLEMFLSSIGKLYELGLNPIIENLYPKVEWPVVRGTQSLSSLLSWDHSESYNVKKFPAHHFRATASDMNCTINLNKSINSFLSDHCIDGNIIYPAAGYLMLAWRQLSNFYGKSWIEVPVIFEDVQFKRALFLYENVNIEIKVRFLQETGNESRLPCYFF